MTKVLLTDLKPGDVLLYRPHNVFDWIVAVKTSGRVSHVEIYAGGAMSVASRNGEGVNTYAFRFANLCRVYRPNTLDWPTAWTWYNEVARGQKYDWKGLLCFTLAVKQGSKDKMFCSEFGNRFMFKGKAGLFDAEWDADRTSPRDFAVTGGKSLIWTDGTLV